MISDNYVTGDNIFLRELQNFFFEVLGMMSITHYGAIGDGRFDNYGALQVAIDDANRRNLNYIYVPYGRYIYTGDLINIGDIEFVGNPHAKIINIRTGAEIEIKQFGLNTKDVYTKAEVDALLARKVDRDSADEDQVIIEVVVSNELDVPITVYATPQNSTTWSETIQPGDSNLHINLLSGSCMADAFSELYYIKEGSNTRYYFDMLTEYTQNTTLHIS